MLIDQDQYWTMKQVAKCLGCSYSRVYGMYHLGKLPPSHTILGRRFWLIEDIEKFKSQHVCKCHRCNPSTLHTGREIYDMWTMDTIINFLGCEGTDKDIEWIRRILPEPVCFDGREYWLASDAYPLIKDPKGSPRGSTGMNRHRQQVSSLA